MLKPQMVSGANGGGCVYGAEEETMGGEYHKAAFERVGKQEISNKTPSHNTIGTDGTGWRALAPTQVRHGSRLSDSCEDGEALSSVQTGNRIRRAHARQ